jgi:hypothetical protein
MCFSFLPLLFAFLTGKNISIKTINPSLTLRAPSLPRPNGRDVDKSYLRAYPLLFFFFFSYENTDRTRAPLPTRRPAFDFFSSATRGGDDAVENENCDRISALYKHTYDT